MLIGFNIPFMIVNIGDEAKGMTILKVSDVVIEQNAKPSVET